jgi:hypothetical protein
MICFIKVESKLKDGVASHRAIGAADHHPLYARRFAPAIKHLQRTVIPASKLAYPSAADPQHR